MDGENDKLICQICKKKYSSVSAKYRHLRDVHNEQPIAKQTVHIKCPICPQEEKVALESHDMLINHLQQIHSLSIKTSLFTFKNEEEFETWRALDNRNVDYVKRRDRKISDGQVVYYECNRSNFSGYTSQCSKRSMKTGGSIKISGFCPSRIRVKICNTGVDVKFVETHVGHDDLLRSKHLTKDQQEMIASKLAAGVTKERILEDARTITGNKLERINVLKRADLAYIIRKFNIEKRRHDDDMVATTLKVKEWNSQGKNYVFLFKQIGETYPGLKAEDFALGFMNDDMERKLKQFKRIICIDGTHGTNSRHYDLTIVLVKDENKIGFPVAFLLSNRLDQTIQNIFFDALKSKIGEPVDAEYIMTDDDIKYYNAWCQAMVTERKPRRLLCTWHVIKNWNIQGRNKLKNVDNKKEMKNRMRKILKETDVSTFHKMKDEYFKHLEEGQENEFLKYLKNYYFQSEERIMMWAHCHRVNVGINTNMAIESLNKVLKYNKMRGNQNLRVEKLLDTLEELVNEKMWKNIIDTERPSANQYQARVNREAHSKAENGLTDKVVCLETGEFRVPSESVSNKFYIVSYNELCDKDCTSLYCIKCKICIHRFRCQCAEFTIKAAMCKHIHAVALVAERSDSVLGVRTVNDDDEDNNLYICQPSTSRAAYEMDVQSVVGGSSQITNDPIDSTTKDFLLKYCMSFTQIY
ncbi:uncharacterized protein LOC123310233 isoform X5 [Coccinella septempunctata]|uniref:uncharacterized protein LOC123308506 isoform X5 n=3 Tax=Coccinella septempunctata TaxID=41139 RepID=UPI001D0780FE|nr:uncharacterized protein LOC123308506 isoform X5 [Coccinella septempunctata]XP_044747492.1 uncharacterized protein LOC123308753 isoform X5 [Coccinella septempunctata]XP_044749630.1 uncharacterized protein LOC123310233 isoform X5 [Coccinella septempunctata]